MAITRFKNSSIKNNTPKYDQMLAGLPYIPTIGTATDGGTGTTVSVAFTGNNVANGTITYTALSNPGSLTGTGTASPITVSGLTSGTAYTFQVKAGNSLGDSAYSAASNSVTPVTPTAFESIATATGTGSSNTITFSSIPSTYQHLQIRAIVKDTITSVSIHSDLSMTINGATSGYAFHHLYGNGATVTATGSASQSSITIAKEFLPTSHTNQTNTMGVLILDLHDYTSTSENKTLRCFYGGDNNNSPTGWAVGLSSALLASTSAVTSLTFTSPATAWTTTTQFALYGIKGA